MRQGKKDLLKSIKEKKEFWELAEKELRTLAETSLEEDSYESDRSEVPNVDEMDHEMEVLNQSVDSLNLDEEMNADTDTEEISRHDQVAEKNLPAKRHVTQLTKVHLKDLVRMQAENRSLSSLSKKNEVKVGNTYIYRCVDIEQLHDTDNCKWGDVSYSKVNPNDDLNLGQGQRRQWRSKDDSKLSKIVVYYPDEQLAILRYHKKMDVTKQAAEEVEVEVVGSNQPATEMLDEEHELGGGTTMRVATPQISDRDYIVDHHEVNDMFITKEFEFLNPTQNMIDFPKGDELYLFRVNPKKHSRD